MLTSINQQACLMAKSMAVAAILVISGIMFTACGSAATGVPISQIPTPEATKALMGNKGKKGADGSVKLVNASGKSIAKLYIGVSGSSEWGDSYITGGPLEDGLSSIINFKPADEECQYDIKSVDKSGVETFWQEVEMCDVKELNLHSENDKNWTSSR